MPMLPTVLFSPSPPRVLAPARVVQERTLARQVPVHRGPVQQGRASHQDVGRLDVAMEHLVRVQMVHAEEQLPQHELVLLCPQPSHLLVGLCVPRQQRHVEEGVNKTNVCLCRGNVQQPQDVWVWRQRDGRGHLKQHTGGQPPLEDLHSHSFASAHGPVHGAERALAQHRPEGSGLWGDLLTLVEEKGSLES